MEWDTEKKEWVTEPLNVKIKTIANESKAQRERKHGRDEESFTGCAS